MLSRPDRKQGIPISRAASSWVHGECEQNVPPAQSDFGVLPHRLALSRNPKTGSHVVRGHHPASRPAVPDELQRFWPIEDQSSDQFPQLRKFSTPQAGCCSLIEGRLKAQAPGRALGQFFVPLLLTLHTRTAWVN